MIKILNKIKSSIQNAKGFSIFLSLLIMSIAATIAFSVFEIFYLQILMTSNIKDSQTAFYAADSGLECIYYWDIKKDEIDIGNPITCANSTKILDLPASDFKLYFSDGSCTTIKINFANPLPDPKSIQSYGRNKYGGADCNNSYPRRVERGIQNDY